MRRVFCPRARQRQPCHSSVHWPPSRLFVGCLRNRNQVLAVLGGNGRSGPPHLGVCVGAAAVAQFCVAAIVLSEGALQQSELAGGVEVAVRDGGAIVLSSIGSVMDSVNMSRSVVLGAA